MKYTVDEIIDDIITLINIDNGEKKFINICDISFNIKENDVLVFENNMYKKDLTEEDLRRQRIIEKMNMLKSSK